MAARKPTDATSSAIEFEHRLVVVDNEYGGFRHVANLPLSWPAG